MDFNHTEAEVTAEITELRERIPNLRDHGTHQAVSTGPLVPGCRICTRMAHLAFQLGFRCNAACDFCFVQSYRADSPDEDELYHRQVLMDEFYRQKDELEGVSLTGGEPLLYLPQIEEAVGEMRKHRPDLHFWVYTNGIIADEDRLKFLCSLGIREIRFNLAASNFSGEALEKVGAARELFDYVVVEVPSYPKQKEDLFGCLGNLDRIGIDQLNLQELLITNNNVHRLEGEGYQTGMLFLTKSFLYGSRRMTYEVMSLCNEKGYAFTVNDCSAGRFGAR